MTVRAEGRPGESAPGEQQHAEAAARTQHDPISVLSGRIGVGILTWIEKIETLARYTIIICLILAACCSSEIEIHMHQFTAKKRCDQLICLTLLNATPKPFNIFQIPAYGYS